jgi:hypothetical protein
VAELTSSVLFTINSVEHRELEIINDHLNLIKRDVDLTLTLLYVKPRLPFCYYHIPSAIELNDACECQARKALSYAGSLLCVKPEDQWISTGRLISETMQLAHNVHADYILAGSIEKKRLSQHPLVQFWHAKKHAHLASISELMLSMGRRETAVIS